MNLNQLYFDHQIASMRAGAAISDGYRTTCLANADRLAAQIGSLQQSLGAAASAAWTAKGCEQALLARQSATSLA